jgi:hypothetical protein
MPINNDDFVHLHVHSDRGSLLDGMVKISEYVDHVKDIGQSHATVTDHGSLGAVFDFVKTARKSNVKPICGIEAYTTLKERQSSGPEDDGSRNYHLILLAQNQQGLSNLIKMNSIAYLEGYWHKPRIDYSLLREYGSDIIASTACLGSVTSQLIGRGEKAEAKKRIETLADIFPGRLFVELQAHGHGSSGSFQRQVNQAMVEFANELDLPLVMTGDSHYKLPTHKSVHNQLLAMQTSGKMWMPVKGEFDEEGYTGRTRFQFETTPLLDTLSMVKLAQEWGIPREAITNTKHLAKMIDSDSYFSKSVNRYPKYEGLPDGVSSHQEIVRLAKSGLTLRMGGKPPKEYRDRLMKELRQLKIMGMCDYMLIMRQWLKECKKKGIHTGPGRGCLAADSFVQTDRGYLRITDVRVGDFVHNKSGLKCEVVETHKYPLRKESLLRLRTAYGVSLKGETPGVALTSDHKVYAATLTSSSSYNMRNCDWKNSLKPLASDCLWIPAGRLKAGDWIWTPSRSSEGPRSSGSIDLDKEVSIAVKSGSQKQYKNVGSSYSSSTIQKRNGNLHSCSSRIWVDNDTAWFMGKWLADGWIRKSKKTIGICYNPKLESSQGERIRRFLLKHNVNKWTEDKGQDSCVDINISNYFLSSWIINWFGLVGSHTKHIPQFVFKKLTNEHMKAFLRGYCDGDGCREKYSWKMKTVSRRLAFDIKKAFSYIGYPCSISEGTKGEYSMRAPLRVFDDTASDYNRNWVKLNNGFFTKISSVTEEKGHTSVYDISVDSEPSYISDIGLVHNSAPGALPAYALGITHVDPIKYDLSFERFMALPRCGKPVLFEDKISNKIDSYLEKNK